MQGISRIAFVAAMVAAPTTLWAQEGELLGQITLTASATAVEVSRTGASVTVLEAEDLAKVGNLSFGRLLSGQAGVAFDANGGIGTLSTLRIRGLAGHYTSTRLDGFDVADLAAPKVEFNANSLLLAGIDRVEILRGAQSARYGSEAIGGVVEASSFRPSVEGTSGRLAYEIGQDATQTVNAAVGLLSERLELAFSAAHGESDGGFSALAADEEEDGYRASMATAYAAYQLSDNLRLGANALWRKNYTEYDSPWAAEGQISTGLQRGIRGFADLSFGGIDHNFAVSRSTYDRMENYGPYQGVRRDLSYAGHWEQSEALSLHWGLEEAKESFDAEGTRGDATTRSLFGEMLYAPSDSLDLSLALRHDDHSRFGGHLTGRFAAAWRFSEGWTLRGVLGTGFRAPSLYELYSSSGHDGLKAEESRSYELGIERAFAAGHIQATLFQTDIDQRIDYVDGPGSCLSDWGCYSQIDGETKSRGLELTAAYDLSEDWTLSGNYTYTDSMDERVSGTTRSLRVPRHSLNLGLEGQLSDRLSTYVSLRHVADNLDMIEKKVVNITDYTLLGASLNYELNDTASAYLRVDNLTDEDYETAKGYNQAGRTFYVGLKTSF